MNININSPHNSKLLYTQLNQFQNDDYLQEWFLQVIRNLFRMYVSNGYLYNNQGKVRRVLIPTQTRLGEQNNTELIKQMQSNKYIYEARIRATQFDHPRILFFLTDNDSLKQELVIPSAIFTFFFVKTFDGSLDGSVDVHTQPLINESGSIREKYFIETFDKKILGHSILREE